MKVIGELAQRACERDAEALEALVRYAKDGKFLGVRDSVVSTLAHAATPNAAWLEANFREWLEPNSSEGQQYWAVLGLVNVLGSTAYPELIAIASNESLPTDIRAHAVKLLATYSGQTFDAGRPSDPGHWRIDDLDISRLSDWASSGYPKGAGYVVPPSDPSLDSPVTRLELAASHLDRLLRQQRKVRFDPANPSNLLVQVTTDKIDAIEHQFVLPGNYSEFLRRFSPLNVVVESRRFVNGLRLYGADDLVSGQRGYSIDALTNLPIPGWPTSMVVVGDDGGDPYTLDLSHTSESDAPICSARHGAGSWTFRVVAPSFVGFVEQLK
jgi:hypothetical protein